MPWLTLAICLACCWGISRLPEDLQRRLRGALLDSSLPIQEAKTSARHLWSSQLTIQNDRLADLEHEYRREKVHWETELRQRELTIARFNARQQIHQQPEASPFPIVHSASLIDYNLISAEIVAPDQLRFVSRELLIRSDELTDLARDSLVVQAADIADETDELDPAEMILDRGETSGLKSKQPVYAGRCVVGTLADVGHWISRVRLLTDPEYRGRARILRQVEDGFAYGPEGILAGTGESLCRLRYLSRTESVRVGDRVYTNGAVPMYYGQIVRAELDENAPEWNVWLKPAIDLESLPSVQVLRQTLDPPRQLAN